MTYSLYNNMIYSLYSSLNIVQCTNVSNVQYLCATLYILFLTMYIHNVDLTYTMHCRVYNVHCMYIAPCTLYILPRVIYDEVASNQ